jgi:hypothetical protein
MPIIKPYVLLLFHRISLTQHTIVKNGDFFSSLTIMQEKSLKCLNQQSVNCQEKSEKQITKMHSTKQKLIFIKWLISVAVISDLGGLVFASIVI